MQGPQDRRGRRGRRGRRRAVRRLQHDAHRRPCRTGLGRGGGPMPAASPEDGPGHRRRGLRAADHRGRDAPAEEVRAAGGRRRGPAHLAGAARMTTPAPECVALAEGLRQVRARTGLSLAALAERTVYSKSSWERYLNGKTPPPRHAVEELCAIAREPAGRLLALWELADAEWSGRARQTRPAAPTPLPVSAPVPAGAT